MQVIHMRWKHTEKPQEIFPVPCEIWKQEVRDKLDMRNHMISHKYTYLINANVKNVTLLEIVTGQCNFIMENLIANVLNVVSANL